jgi:hypothetical protein
MAIPTGILAELTQRFIQSIIDFTRAIGKKQSGISPKRSEGEQTI